MFLLCVLSVIIYYSSHWVAFEIEIEVEGVFSLKELGRMVLVIDLHPKDRSILELKVSYVHSSGLVCLQISDLSSMALHYDLEVLIFLHPSSKNGHVHFSHLLVDGVLDFLVEILGIEGR